MKSTRKKSNKKIVTAEELYKLMQVVSSSVLRNFKNTKLETFDVANELFLRWLQTGGKPKFRRLIYKGKKTKPSTSLVLPIRANRAYHIISSDAKNFLKSYVRKSLPTISLEGMSEKL